MLDGGPIGRIEKTQQTSCWRREEEEVLKVESEDNLLSRAEIRFLSKTSREHTSVQTVIESSGS